jgi:dihydrofolate synthase/folylpolyglutamate synthase
MNKPWHIPEPEPPIELFAQLSEWGSFRPGLDHVRDALARLGNPQKRFRQILIGGTNGKGTVAFNLSRNLEGKCGCFLSPHVVDIRERILIDGEVVPDHLWQKAYETAIQILSPDDLSYFEWTLVLAILIFDMEDVAFGVFEVGVGGREDATNVLDPELSCIVSVGLDHEEILGRSLESIAIHKIGIGRPDRPLFLPGMIASFPKVVALLNENNIAYTFHNFDGFSDHKKLIKLILKELGLITKVKPIQFLPGRQMTLTLGKANWYLDGAHNPAAWQGYAKWLADQEIEPLPFIAAVSAGRNPHVFLESFSDRVERVYVWCFSEAHTRMMPKWEKACAAASKPLEVLDSESFSRLQQQSCIVTGSLYLVGQALRRMKLSDSN